MYNVFALGTMLLILIIPDYSLGMCRVDKQPLRVKFADKINGPKKIYWVRTPSMQSSTDKAAGSNKPVSVPIGPNNIELVQSAIRVMVNKLLEDTKEANNLLIQGQVAEAGRKNKDILDLSSAVLFLQKAIILEKATLLSPQSEQKATLLSPQSEQKATTPSPLQPQTSSPQDLNTSTKSRVTSSWGALF